MKGKPKGSVEMPISLSRKELKETAMPYMVEGLRIKKVPWSCSGDVERFVALNLKKLGITERETMEITRERRAKEERTGEGAMTVSVEMYLRGYCKRVIEEPDMSVIDIRFFNACPSCAKHGACGMEKDCTWCSQWIPGKEDRYKKSIHSSTGAETPHSKTGAGSLKR